MALQRFGANGVEFGFDVNTGDLVGPRGTTRLRPQAATVLSALLGKPGELVTRAELKKLVWPDTFVEADQGLNFCIRQIRVALGDEGDNGKFIETLPRRGYRFVAKLRNPDIAPKAFTAPSRIGAAIGVIALAALGAFWFRRPEPPPDGAVSLKVAVLPFTALDVDQSLRELSRDIADRLVVDLTASAQNIGVIGPATTGAYVGDARPHTIIGRELGVDLVVSGVMRLSDSTLFVQGVRTSDGVHTFAWREPVWNRGTDSIVASLSRVFHDKVFGGTHRVPGS